MPRVRSSHRLASLVEAAGAAFVAHGYARTQVEDVAERLGVAKGTIYGYVTSKEALFALVLMYGDGLEPLPDPTDLPLAVDDLPRPGTLVADRLGSEVEEMVLLAAAQAPAVDGASEVQRVVEDLLVRLGRHRVAIKVVDRCAAEFPELADVWFQDGRWGLVELLAGYLERQAEQGRLGMPGDARVLARSIVELCALWAVHLHWDPSPRPVPGDIVLASVPRIVRQMVTAPSGPAIPRENDDE